ncbi:outer membrane protein OmpA-like peptidoglycan-associated protein [Elusimicrobium posterum]|uniref:OmpA family protein n=1 Tax=Elusimicrobium posterum TaxID=3116653 RepID=UPI003C7951D0
MKYFKLLLIPVLMLGLVACSSSNKKDGEVKPDPIIEKEAKKNAKWAKQTSKQMYLSGNIPTVDFEFDSARLATSAYPILDKVAEFMVPNPKIKLIIHGHTDRVGDPDYNYWLGARRAMEIKSYLVSRGVYPDYIKIYSYGSSRPLTYDDSPEGRRTNRRVEFIITDRHWHAVY